MKKMITLMAMMAILCPSTNRADGPIFCEPTGGCGYEECRQATCTPAAIALAAVALGGIIAVIVQNRSGNNHSHSH